MEKVLAIITLIFVFTECSTNPESAKKTIQGEHSPNTYFTGDGGREKSLGILVPESQGLPSALDYIPAMIQGSLVTNISRFSAISVLDRVALDKVIAETLDPAYEDNLDIVRLGHITHVGYMMTGQIIRTSTGYNLRINVSDTKNGMTIASYSGMSTIADLDNLTAIQLASKELLTQMGITLTKNAINELDTARTQQTIGAETALARGITAQRQGTEVAALSYYFQAATLDPSLQEAANRSSVMSANISSGNISADIRNDIQWRKDWIAMLAKTEEFLYGIINTREPPYTLFYSTGIKTGAIDYQTETANLSVLMNLRTNNIWLNSVAQAAQSVYTGLNATKRKEVWGLGNWPQQGLTDKNPFGSEKRYDFSIVFELLNEHGKLIGRKTVRLAPVFSLSRNNDRIVMNYAENIFNIVTFDTVKVDDISDNLTIRIATVNGTPPENSRFPITAVSDSMWQEYSHLQITRGVLRGFNQTLSSSQREQYRDLIIWGGPITSIGSGAFYANNLLTSVTIGNGVTAIGERAFEGSGNYSNLTNVIIGDGVTYIGDRAFYSNKLTSITIPNGVKSIGKKAFASNSLTSVSIPNSVTTIEDDAFHYNRITSVTIGNSVTSIGYGAFSLNQLTSITIGANVNFHMMAFDSEFYFFYEKNGHRAGTYNYDRNKRTWNYSGSR